MATYGEIKHVREQIARAAQRITDANEQYASAQLYDVWHGDHFYKVGEICRWPFENSSLYKRKQPQNFVEIYTPDAAPALWDRIPNPNEDGTPENPISYGTGMELTKGKYYTENGKLYYCENGSGQAVYDTLANLFVFVREVV